jgi:hypothetical protein
MARLNCWEFMQCGREYGGCKENEKGVCSAFTETRLNSVHSGKNAGRACWAVAGTLCHGKAQGSFALTNNNCFECSFYMLVKSQEGADLIPTYELLQYLR